MTGEMSDDQDDALTVARWCFPEQEWEPTKITGRVRAGFDRFDAEDRESIAAAEQVVLARGLAEQYGRALASEVFYRGVITKEGMARHSWAITKGTEMASLATAPLASRLRALARVARENPMTPRETPCPFVHGDAMCGCSCGKECGKFSGHCREHGNLVRFGGSPVARAKP